jgi:hypothetical protein
MDRDTFFSIGQAFQAPGVQSASMVALDSRTLER